MFRTECRGIAHRVGMVAGLTGVAVCLFVLASCNKPQSGMAPTVLPREGKPVMHAVVDQDLRQAMQDLNALASQQVWMGIYTSGEPAPDMSKVAALADKMAQAAANRLPQAVADNQMDSNERQVYLGLSQKLHDQAVVLKQQADRNELSAAQGTMTRITNTCNSCHTLFRDVAGPI